MNSFTRLLPVFLVFAGGLILGGFLKSDTLSVPNAFAQNVRPTAARGIMAFTGQIDRDQYGLFMVDADAGTVWVYQLKRPGYQLKLLAARSWVYDRQLEEYNCASLTPSEVAQLVTDQQSPENGSKKLENEPSGPVK